MIIAGWWLRWVELPAGYSLGVEYEREYPVWPWKLWGDSEPEKAKLEMAIHRVAAAEWYAEQGGGWERCGECRERRRMVPVADSEVRLPKTGRIRFEVRCSDCGATSLRSRHPNPIRPPGLG